MITEVHRAQYAIGRSLVAPSDQWRSINLPEGFILSYHKNLRVTVDSPTKVTLGHKLGSGERAAGRWVQINWPFIEPDPSALLSITYSTDGSRWIASSPFVVHAPNTSRPPLPREGFNWDPTPGTRLPSWRKVLHRQSFDVVRHECIETRRDFAPISSYDSAVSQLADSLTDTAGQIARNSDRIWLAITGGKDSRTLAASMIAAGVPFNGVTQLIPGMPRSDIIIAQQVCKRLGVSHHIMEPLPFDAVTKEKWECHTGGSYCDADNYLFPHHQYRFLSEGDVLIRGGLFEIGRRFFRKRLSGLDYDNVSGPALLKRFTSDFDNESLAYINEWLAGLEGVSSSLSFIDRFYLEQRVGGWLSSIEQGLDMLPGSSIHPANSVSVFNAMLAPDVSAKEAGSIQTDTIKLMAPELSQIPFNKLTLADQARRIGRKVRSSVIAYWD